MNSSINSKKLFLFSKNKKSKNSTEFILSDAYKNMVCSHSYLGKKGYTIPKSILNPEDLEFLKKDLLVKPELFGGVPFHVGSTFMQENSFPVYRENAQKIYIPRFYGLARYGTPELPCEMESGENIQVEFAKSVRDYQEEIIKTYIDHVKPNPSGGGAILEVPCGQGKCLGKDTPIIMYDGTLKMVQDVIVGDVIMGDDSTPRNVLSTIQGREQLYKVSEVYSDEKNGEGRYETTSYIVNESHILSLKDKEEKNIDINILDYLQELETTKREHWGYRVPITFRETPIELDPYELGNWIGCNAVSPSLCSPLHADFINKYKLSENIVIPYHYKCNTKKIQTNVLKGIMNSPIYHEEYFETNKKILANDIVFLLRSLGYFVMVEKKIFEENEYYRIHMRTYGLTYKIKIEKIDYDIQNEYYGFEIDGNRRFVLGDYSVTHNTVMALKIISILQKKTLILVHKEFLMNQWIERISEFLPNASVGKIQGQVIDVKGRDIVIGMIQSIYDKDYPSDMFSSFGLTIIDEVHRIGSEQFSKTLLKTISPYMLGISATVDRKDKLTKILYMFIGEKVYSNKTRDDDKVYVRAIEYKSSDAEFNEVECDYRGNPMYSKMIVKLCEYGPRSDFIVKIIRDLIEENPGNQIMILAHNRSLLTYLYDSIRHKNIASVGYYVGGMKHASLQESEGKQIVVATYAMAAEALDIKTLSTLVMVTPKTDIVQSVGRILRMKHSTPIIVDIVDGHEPFKNQWKQRLRYYKKCNYSVHMCNSNQYGGMGEIEISSNWKLLYNPKAGSSCSPDGEKEDITSDDNAPKIGKCLISWEEPESLENLTSSTSFD
jgi:superfamily II DNA or RNA helicase